MNKKKGLYIASLVFLIITLPLIVVAARIAFNIRNSANVEIPPEEIVVSEVSTTSVTISWYTPEPAVGLVNYGTDSDNLNLSAGDDRDETTPGDYNVHYVKIDNLSPNTVYYYEILSGSETYQNSAGSPYTFKTLSTTDSVGTPIVRYGSVTPQVTEGVVYAYASNGSETSTVTSSPISSSNYAISLSNLKDRSTGGLFDLSNSDVLISVTDSQGNRGSLQISGADDTERLELINLTSGGEIFDQDVVFAVTENGNNNNNETTPTPAPPVIGNENTQNIINNKVSFGREETNPTIPYNIYMSNIRSSGFCINWLTKQPTIGEISYIREAGNNTRALDLRDSVSEQLKRYTHTACIEAPDFSEEERVGFYIYSNSSPFGANLTTERFVFAMPPITDSPPSPGSVQGVLNKSFEPISEDSKRDSLISGRYFNTETDKSTWVSTVPSSSNTSNWSLTYNSILNTDLEGFYSETAPFIIEASTEFNGFAETEINDPEAIVELSVNAGLAVTSPEHNSRLSSANRIEGTSNPNSEVTLEINNQELSTNSDDIGRWALSFNELTSGTYSVSSTSSSTNEVLGLTFSVIGLDGEPPDPTPVIIPDTALDSTNIIPIFIASTLVLIGIYIRNNIKQRRNSLDSL